MLHKLVLGKQPLSWTARATIALDAAKGIEHIHDHTKSRCVHRDIKTSNILLAEGPRAKVLPTPNPSSVLITKRTKDLRFLLCLRTVFFSVGCWL